MSSVRTTISSLSTFRPTTLRVGSFIASISVSLDGLISNSTFSYLLKSPAIYEVLSNSNSDFTSATVKTNFATTGSQSINQGRQDILMPPHFFCNSFSNITTYLFYGGVIRF